MGRRKLNSYRLGELCCIYILDEESGRVGFTICPAQMEDRLCLEGNWMVESLVQVKCADDIAPDGFSCGMTMRNSQSAMEFLFADHQVAEDGTIVTEVRNRELKAFHYVRWLSGQQGVWVWTELQNTGTREKEVELLSSFSLCSLFPFEEEERTQDFDLYRLGSRWSGEGRLERRSFQELQLEPSWQNYGVRNMRFGQTGTMPVRGYFPWMVLADRKYRCWIGAMLSWGGSWQMELYSQDSRPACSGGLADRELGHWMKVLKPGERLVSPKAFLAVSADSLDSLCNNLLTMYQEQQPKPSKKEEKLPIVFNEFCTTWGHPSEKQIEEIAGCLEGKGVEYLVIDAGWYADSHLDWESNMGDWKVNETLFPAGMKKTAENIKRHGMVPGIWFEPECVGRNAGVYQRREWLLSRDNIPVTTRKRRFFDLRKQAVREYLEEKVISFLKDNGFGYLKLDYNDTVGLGCDGAESPGEGLRQQVLASVGLFRKIKEELPEVILENCSSGGHRLEPGLVALADLSSFSDAHECVSIPLIAAGVQRAVPPSRCLIWAVLRRDDDEKRMYYSMTAAFLGRICLSGDILEWSAGQWEILLEGIRFYEIISDIIKYGETSWFGVRSLSLEKPAGWQAVLRKRGKRTLIVVHKFDSAEEILRISLPHNSFRVTQVYSRKNVHFEISRDSVEISAMMPMEGAAALLEDTTVNDL